MKLWVIEECVEIAKLFVIKIILFWAVLEIKYYFKYFKFFSNTRNLWK